MSSFSLSNNDVLIFNIVSQNFCETHLTVKNTSESYEIFTCRTNSKIPFVVKPVKFYLAPNDSIDIRFTLRKNDLESLDLNNLPTQEKIEIMCLPVSEVFANSLISAPDKVYDSIQRRFKTHSEDIYHTVNSVDTTNSVDTVNDNTEAQIEKHRLRIIYNFVSPAELNGELEAKSESISPVCDLAEAPVQKKYHSVMNVISIVVLFILWSVLMIYLGNYLSSHPFSK